MYKKGAGNDKQGKDAGNRTLCPYRNFSQAIKIMNEYSIYLFCITIKDLSISFSKVVTVQDFKTVTFDKKFVYKLTFSVVFC